MSSSTITRILLWLSNLRLPSGRLEPFPLIQKENGEVPETQYFQGNAISVEPLDLEAVFAVCTAGTHSACWFLLEVDGSRPPGAAAVLCSHLAVTSIPCKQSEAFSHVLMVLRQNINPSLFRY